MLPAKIPPQNILFNSQATYFKKNEHKGFHVFLRGIISISLQNLKFIEGK